MLLRLLRLPFRVVAAAIRLLLKVILMPLKIIVGGMLFRAAMLVVFLAVVAILVYVVYQALT
jgi:hypothetical protein